MYSDDWNRGVSNNSETRDHRGLAPLSRSCTRLRGRLSMCYSPIRRYRSS